MSLYVHWYKMGFGLGFCIKVLQGNKTNGICWTRVCIILISILRNWLTQLWKLTSLEFVDQAGRLEIQGRVDIEVSNMKSAGWKLRQGFYVAVFKQNLFFGKPQFLLLRIKPPPPHTYTLWKVKKVYWFKCWSHKKLTITVLILLF